MSKKITRRVVLGTVIAGLAVGPFAIRSLKRNSGIDIGLFDADSFQTIFEKSEAQKTLYNNWLECKKAFNLPIAIRNNRNSFSIKQDFSINRNYNFSILSTDINEAVQSLDNCLQKNLLLFISGEGNIVIPAPPPNVFTANFKDVSINSVDFSELDGRLDQMRLDRGVTHYFRNEKSELSFRGEKAFAGKLLDWLVFPIPQREVRIGDTFLPITPLLPGIAMNAKIEGMAKYINFETLKISAEKHLTEEDFQSYFQATGEELITTIVGTDGDDYDEFTKLLNNKDVSEEIKALVQEQMEIAQKEESEWQDKPQKMYYKTTAYVDIDSGLTVFREDINVYDDQCTLSLFQLS